MKKQKANNFESFLIGVVCSIAVGVLMFITTDINDFVVSDGFEDRTIVQLHRLEDKVYNLENDNMTLHNGVILSNRIRDLEDNCVMKKGK